MYVNAKMIPVETFRNRVGERKIKKCTNIEFQGQLKAH
jgi:hypothetical protein